MAKAIFWARIAGQCRMLAPLTNVTAFADTLAVDTFTVPIALALTQMCHLTIIARKSRLTETAREGRRGLERQHAITTDAMARAALAAVLLSLLLLQLVS